jgi:hypothetical protein
VTTEIFYLNVCTITLPDNLFSEQLSNVPFLASLEVKILQQLVPRKIHAAYWQTKQEKTFKHKVPLIYPCF